MTSLAERVPTLTDDELKNLRVNADRLQDQGSATQQAAAVEILPVIDAEMAARAERAPVKPKAKRAPAKPRVKRAAKTAEPEAEAEI